MPIRIRTTENKSVTLDSNARFIEVVEDEGYLLTVVYPDANGTVTITYPGEELYQKYCKLFKVEKPSSKTVRLSR